LISSLSGLFVETDHPRNIENSYKLGIARLENVFQLPAVNTEVKSVVLFVTQVDTDQQIKCN